MTIATDKKLTLIKKPVWRKSEGVEKETTKQPPKAIERPKIKKKLRILKNNVSTDFDSENQNLPVTTNPIPKNILGFGSREEFIDAFLQYNKQNSRGISLEKSLDDFNFKNGFKVAITIAWDFYQQRYYRTRLFRFEYLRNFELFCNCVIEVVVQGLRIQIQTLEAQLKTLTLLKDFIKNGIDVKDDEVLE